MFDEAGTGEVTERCFLCRTSEAVCYWPVRASYTPRRRVLLLLSSLLVLMLPAGFFYFFFTERNVLVEQTGWWLLLALSVIGTAYCLMGIAVSIRGCKRCVVRLFGSY